jgi:hypothetical protein
MSINPDFLNQLAGKKKHQTKDLIYLFVLNFLKRFNIFFSQIKIILFCFLG